MWTSAFLSLVHLVIGWKVYNNPDETWLAKRIGLVSSLIFGLILLYFGTESLHTVRVIGSDINSLCQGGFPQMHSIGKAMVENYIEVENHYLNRFMCNKDYCPCSETVDPGRYGAKQSLFGNNFSNSGSVYKFYE